MANNNPTIVAGLKELADIFAPGSEAGENGMRAFTIALPEGKTADTEALLRHLKSIGFNQPNPDGVYIGNLVHDEAGNRIELILEKIQPGVYKHLANIALPFAIKNARKEAGMETGAEVSGHRAAVLAGRSGATVASSHLEAALVGRGRVDSRGGYLG